MLQATISRDDYDFSLLIWSKIFDKAQLIEKDDKSAVLSFIDRAQATAFQVDYISATTHFGTDENDEPTGVGLRMESIYDRHFLFSEMKVVE